ncbi:uncharacterized protein BJ212DRAFT_1448651 [Suillus subaureus]|uniref:Uncharacterized protein n=1 Tax=Suillus subaureus TaxID=48587 RepID=A0A9P7E4I0_9AGAM|nr:uncharacterized protein BJ212DRAFT_1448651 [Suillus subaureus]KAG1810598.1 hypothetical protein BJ212DRAFT_1448651 [Suillus subaureus]
MPVGDVKWQSFKVQYMGEKPAHDVPPWMTESHDVICNLLANPDYTTEMDYQPYHEFSTDNNKHQWQDFMSGDWAWNQADIISQDSDTAGSMFVPVILGSDKMTISVATGANDYYLLYASIGNIHNNVRHTHHDAVAIIGFLAMLKTTKEHVTCPKYQKYCWQMFHSSILKILENLRPGMTKPEVVCFGDSVISHRHYQCVIYGLGLYIADYEEQVLLACIVCSWCPRCMSHCKDLDSKLLYCNHDHTEALIEEVISSDLWDEFGIITDLVLIALDILHQLIKGMFKDHLVEWVGQYLHHMHGKKRAEKIQDDIGRGFKQWTSDNSKVLMKVYLPTIEGYVPTDMVCTFCVFLEFCYLVWCNIIMELTLVRIQDTLDQFHCYRKIFKSTGMKHIKAVKEPWRCSSPYHALGQMLVTNQHLDKLAASHINFKSSNEPNENTITLSPDCNITIQGDNKEGEIVDGPTLVQAHIQLAKTHCKPLSIPYLNNLLHQFLFKQLHLDNECSPSDVLLTHCPQFNGKIQVFNSAASIFYAPHATLTAPSNRSGIGGINEALQYDCVFVNTDAAIEGMGGMDIGHIMGFFSFTFKAVSYPCAVVHWFKKVNDGPDKDTSMWIVKPSYDTDQSPLVGIIHVDSIYQAAHLIPIYGMYAIPKDLKHYDSYDAFCAFYINKFADHHAFKITS